MDLRRFTRVIGDRWLVVLIGGVVGLLGAILFLALSSPSGDSLYEATATVTFEPAEGQTIPDLAEDLRAARDFAVIAAEELLSSDPTSQITVDLPAAALNFTSRGPNEAEATQKAQSLLDSYLAVDPEISGSVDSALAQLEQEAVDLDEQIAGLQPRLTDEEQRLAEDRAQLNASIEQINTRIRELILSEAEALSSDDRRNFAEQREQLELTLEELRDERSALRPAPVAELSTQDALLLQSLQARREQLNTEYQRLYLRKLGVTSQGRVDRVRTQSFAADPLDPVMVVTMGLVGGVLVAALGLLMVSRTRRIVWLPGDLDVPVLGQIPARPVDARGNEVWYYDAEPGPRKTAVQALRSAVQAQAHSSGSTIALTGHNISSEDVQALTADLAGSMASAGDSVLLIDANFASRSALGAYRVGGLSLAEILRLTPDAPDFTESIDRAVEEAHVVRPGLSVIPSGPPPGSPADALAGRQFRSLIAAAEAKYDATILVVDDFGTSASKVAMQRMRNSIIVTSPGSTTETEVNGLLDDAYNLRINVIGAVFVGKRGWLSRLSYDRPGSERIQSREASPEVVAEMPSPMTRLHNYSIPDERRSSLAKHSPLGEFATSFGLAEMDRGDDLGAELLAALEGVGSKRSLPAVADYVISRAEDMVTARPGYGGLPDSLIDDITRYGFLSLKPVKNHRTVGSWLTQEIEQEVEWQSGAEVVSEFARLLSGDSSEDSIDDWLDREFFQRHLLRTQGEPDVWHLVSPERAVSILVPARRVNTDTLESVITDLVSTTIDELERKRRASVTKGDLEAAALYELQIVEIRLFEVGLHEVMYGYNGDRRSGDPWHPDWSNGTRANLAPFQRHGLLPFDVLSEEEMAALLATA